MSKGLFVSLFGHAVIVGVTAYNGLMVDVEKTTASLPPQNDAIGDLIQTLDMASPEFSKRLMIGDESNIPIGAYDFCERRADLCTFGLKGEFLQMGKTFSRDELSEVNNLVNAMFISSHDINTFGQDEFWYIPDAEGEPEMGGLADCEDYTLAKRKMLIERGWAAQDLYVAVVRQRDESQEGHALLIARNPATDEYYGLDNLSETLLSLSEINERYAMAKVNVGAMNTWHTATLEFQPPI